MIIQNPQILIKPIMVGAFAVNCYLVKCQKTSYGAVIDPGGEAETILAEIKKQKIDLKAIIITHGHGDHLLAVDTLMKNGLVPLYIHTDDADMLTNPAKNLSLLFGFPFKTSPADHLVKDHDTIKIGEITLTVIHTPGHTPGGISLQYDKYLFTGDTLFSGSVGRTDFTGSSQQQLINSIKTKLLTFPDDYLVLPGHGGSSTIGREKNDNPFL
jgi:hydroxyacylglutathione hydrolase